MAHFHNNALIGASGAGGAGEFKIERSLRFDQTATAHLSRTPSANGNKKKWTWSGWVKRCTNGNRDGLFEAEANGNYTLLRIRDDNDTISLDQYGGGNFYVLTDAVFRDNSAWYHIVCAVDTTQSTDSNRVKIYVNGVQQTLTAGTSWPSQNQDTRFNDTSYAMRISGVNGGTQFDGYMAEIHIVDGQALAPTDFGEFDADTGAWNPIEYSGSHGTNGAHLDFSDNSSTSALGNDAAGSNNFTANNFSVASGEGNDSLLDTPNNYQADSGNNGGNYCVWNRLSSNGGVTIKNGNLDTVNTGQAYDNPRATFGMSSGKWYWEVKLTSFAGGFHVGLALPNAANSSYLGATSGTWAYGDSGQKYDQGSSSSYGASFTSVGDVVSCAFDADAGSVVFYKNGVSQGTAFTGLTNGPYLPALYARVNSTGGSWNFGQRPFTYTPPSGHKALCTTNLPDPGVADSTTAFDVITATGTAADRTFTMPGGFGPDFVWAKQRNADSNNALFDTVRGATKRLISNSRNNEDTQATQLKSFSSTGFTYGSDIPNNSGQTGVYWCWDGGTSTVSNTDGSITSQVRASTSNGFSIVKYTGTQQNATVGHGLNAAPDWIIFKDINRNDEPWFVYHSSLGEQAYLFLNTTAGETTGQSDFMNSTAPTSSVFSLGNAIGKQNRSGSNFLALCWTAIDGFSAFGSYTGNNSADGPFIYTGFKVAWLMIKRRNGSANWFVVDNARDPDNDVHKYLKPNTNSAEIDTNSEGTKNNLDFLSNGFKLRGTEISTNASQTYVYFAFAENPFKTARAR
jgi:hypothetical protein